MSNAKMHVLNGHNSPETAFVIEDYPFGRSIRCAKRVWIETKERHGQRMCSQTTKKSFNETYTPFADEIPTGDTNLWNKPKCSTYSDFIFLVVDDEEKVQRCGFSMYSKPELVLEIERDDYSHFDKFNRERFELARALNRQLNKNAWDRYEAEQSVTVREA
jgi:hypothetical protein